MCRERVIRHSSSPDGASPPLAAVAEALPTAVEPADAAATLGKLNGCPVLAEEPKAVDLPKGVLLPIELLPKGKLLPIALLPKGILPKGPPLVMPKPPLLAAVVVVLLLVPAQDGAAGLTAFQSLRGFKPWA